MHLASVLRARQRLQTGALSATGREGGKEQLQPGTIIISSVSYICAVELGKIRYELDPDTGNWKRLQSLTATVKKTILATAPAKKTVLTFGGANYQIDEVSGQNSTDLVWILKAERKLPSPS